MVTTAHLLARLDAIAGSLATDSRSLALLALGSVGTEIERIDEWSDLDFFVIVEPGAKDAYIADLWWLSAAAPLVWSFPNTADGHKALMHDGVLCEFAVFAPDELVRIAYTAGRVVWRREGFDADIATSALPLPSRSTRDAAWIANEALSNVLVGLQRWHRGERLAAMRMIEVFAVDRLLELIDRTPASPGVSRDPFNLERRVEARHPEYAEELARCAQGIDHLPASALALLAALTELAPVDDVIATRIKALAARTV